VNAAKASTVKQITEGARPCFGIWTKPAIALYIADILLHHTAGVDAAAGQHVFVCCFERSVPGKGQAELGALHSLEIPYVFGALGNPTWRWLPFTAADVALSNLVQTYWTNFAKTVIQTNKACPIGLDGPTVKWSSLKSERMAQSPPSATSLTPARSRQTGYGAAIAGPRADAYSRSASMFWIGVVRGTSHPAEMM
jgi:Carboxylesterase family